MLKTESIQENDLCKILRDFDKQTDYLIQARKPDQVIISKKNERKETKRPCQIEVSGTLADHH